MTPNGTETLRPEEVSGPLLDQSKAREQHDIRVSLRMRTDLWENITKILLVVAFVFGAPTK